MLYVTTERGRLCYTGVSDLERDNILVLKSYMQQRSWCLKQQVFCCRSAILVVNSLFFCNKQWEHVGHSLVVVLKWFICFCNCNVCHQPDISFSCSFWLLIGLIGKNQVHRCRSFWSHLRVEWSIGFNQENYFVNNIILPVDLWTCHFLWILCYYFNLRNVHTLQKRAWNNS